jgi:hypothetical protein
MRRFLKIVLAVYVLNAIALLAGMVWAFRFLQETDDAEGDVDPADWGGIEDDTPVPTLPPRNPQPEQPKPGIPTGRVFDMRGTEYRFDQETSTFQPVQVNNIIQGDK